MDLPGVPLDADVRGRRAGEVLSAGALAALVRAHASPLGLAAADLSDDSRLPLFLDDCLAATAPTVRATARQIARQYGRRLGYLLLTLKRGDAANRAARIEWDDSYWAYWAGIRQIWLGGGLMSGQLGPLAVEAAAMMLVAGGVTDCTLRLAEQPGLLPLLGAARAVPPGYATAAVLDCGGTSIKRGVAAYDAGGALLGVRLLPSLPTQVRALGLLPPMEQAVALAPVLVEALAATWRAATKAGEGLVAPVLTASIAAYVVDNQPMDYQRGAYAELRLLSPNLGAWLAERVSAVVGQEVTVQLLHDGTAARVYAGQPDSAVILLGTALGVGFPPGV
jgi:hypothetical protein